MNFLVKRLTALLIAKALPLAISLSTTLVNSSNRTFREAFKKNLFLEFRNQFKFNFLCCTSQTVILFDKKIPDFGK
jgi:hypothetical protein